MYVYSARVRRTREEADATRSELRDAALAVFAERGYSAARLEEIAERAGVTRGALYHHYADKAELYLAVIDETWWQVTAPIFGALEGDGRPLERLERFVVGYVLAIDEDPRFRALLSVVTLQAEGLPELALGLEQKERALEGWLARLEGLLSEAKRRGELAERLRPADAALAVLCFVNGITTTATLSPRLLRRGKRARALARALVGGLKR
jgi:TetR/AcrR family transcriptional regulator, acrAB operon repressor